MITSRKLTPVAILGSGNIGTDPLLKIQRSEWLECKLFVGHNTILRGWPRPVLLGCPYRTRALTRSE